MKSHLQSTVKPLDTEFLLSREQWILVRVFLGVYLFCHYAYLVPYAGELFSDQGVLPAQVIQFTELGKVFSQVNPLYTWPSPEASTALLATLAGLSLTFAGGVWPRATAFLLWLGSIWILDRNHYLTNPATAMTGLLLLVYAVSNTDPLKPPIPRWFYLGIWVIAAVAYSISGFEKLASPGWQKGEAVAHMLKNPLAHDIWFRELLLKFPDWILAGMGWIALASELLFAPLALFSVTRPWIWLGMTLIQVGIFLVLDIADITFGVLIMHAFLARPQWLWERTFMKDSGTNTQPIIFYDGLCGLCNKFIQTVVHADQKRNFLLAPLQGETAAKVLPASDREALKSVVVKTSDQKILRDVDAVAHILRRLNGPLSFLGWILEIFPRRFARYVYEEIAVRRYKIFGKLDACPLPTPEERARFLA